MKRKIIQSSGSVSDYVKVRLQKGQPLKHENICSILLMIMVLSPVKSCTSDLKKHLQLIQVKPTERRMMRETSKLFAGHVVST